jgi:hypothetical protein
MKHILITLTTLAALNANAASGNGGAGNGVASVSTFSSEKMTSDNTFIGKIDLNIIRQPSSLEFINPAIKETEQVFEFDKTKIDEIDFSNHVIVSEEFDTLTPKQHLTLATAPNSEELALSLSEFAVADGIKKDIFVVPQSLNKNLISATAAQKIRMIASEGTDCIFETIDLSNNSFRYIAPIKFVDSQLPAIATDALRESAATGAWVDVVKSNEF